MRQKHSTFNLIMIIAISFACNLFAQEQTVGLFLNEEQSFEGYTLFTSMRSTATYLIDNEGREVHSWDTQNERTQMAYLAGNGDLVVSETPIGNNSINAPGGTGIVEKYDWDGNLIWNYELNDSDSRLHHDIEVLPNGNILMIVWENKTVTEAIEQGRNPNNLDDDALWPDYIIEVEPNGISGGNIIWEWHAWDHLIQDYDSSKLNYGVVMEHPELIDLNYSTSNHQAGIADWLHTNGIDYNEELDQIIISVHNFSEVWIIDHSTTTAEAASHEGGNNNKGGDLLYRWGNPQAYDSGTSAGRKLFGQHDSQWIENGFPGEENILVYNNGIGRPEGNYSTVDEIGLPVDGNGIYLYPEIGEAYAPTNQNWIYQAENPTDFYSQNISGTQRLPNGNTLICEGQTGTFFEVTEDSEIVWEYVNPVVENGPLYWDEEIPSGQGGFENSTFKIKRYASDYSAFDDVELIPGEVIELPTENPENYHYKIVDTGQILNYDDEDEISEPSIDEPFYGQDAQYDGNQPNYIDNGDGTITDNVTGLMWTKTCDLTGDGVIDHDDKLTYDEAVASASSVDVGGYNDWRLPDIKEQYSLILFSGIDCSNYQGNDPSELTPFIDTDYFDFGYGDTNAGDRIIDSQMATSTLYVGTTMNGNETMFGVNFADGRIKGYPSDQLQNGDYKEYYVYYVRGNEVYGINDFIDNGDGTITDNATDLMWQQNDTETGLNWEEALDWAQQKNSENYLGYNDWRLPNVKELQSIVDYTRSPATTNSAAIDPLFTCSVITDEGGDDNYPSYWTGTTHTNMQNGYNGAYVCFGEALGWMEMPPNSGNQQLLDVHGAGAQRSDPKSGDPEDWPYGHGPQGDVIRIYNYGRLVRDSQSTVGIIDGGRSTELPHRFSIKSVYPNPFNPVTTIEFVLLRTSDVRISIFSTTGREIDNLHNGVKEAGTHQITWNAKNHPSGLYFIKMVSNGFIQTQKLILLK